MTAMLLAPDPPVRLLADDPFGELLSALAQPFAGALRMAGPDAGDADDEAPAEGADDADGAEKRPGSPDSGR